MINKKTFLYQINVTRDCNLRCTHCYISNDVKAASQKMTDEQFLGLIDGVVKHLSQASSHNHAEIHVIGGEPSMMGLEFYTRVMPKARELLSKIQDNGKSYELMMVTNLTHKKQLEISKLFDRISTSYEPETRFPTNRLFNTWLDACYQHMEAGITLSVTTAITRQVIEHGAAKLLDFYYKHNIKLVHFGFFIPEGEGLNNIKEIMPEFEETSRFLIEAAEWYFANKDPEVFINPVESMMLSLETGKPVDDIVCPIISGSVDVHWDGNVATCLEQGGGDSPDWSGNAFELPLGDVIEGEHFQKEVSRSVKGHSECEKCRFEKNCRSACSVLWSYWNPKTDSDCPGFKKFIRHVNRRRL
jgi:radical SAM protein with 4Fe4S-binding SPASM domain